jgi:benzoate-CoA ligase family protein
MRRVALQDHAVAVDHAPTPSAIAFAPIFNVAVPFIDRHLSEGRSEKTAIRAVADNVTYGELATQVNRCGNVLREIDLSPGDRLLMIVKDCPAFFYLFWGAIKAGIVPVPANTLLRAPDYQYMIDDSACAAVVYSPEFASEVTPALASAARHPKVFATEGNDTALQVRLARASTTLAPVPTTPDDDCFWLYSSGSTGRPKGAVHRHRDIVVTCVHYAVNTLGMGEEDICFSAAKLFFAYGLGNAMTFPLWVGATAVLSDQRPAPQMTFDLIDRFKPTLYFGVPTLYAAQLRELGQAPRDVSSLRLCVSAGEALPPDIFRRWQALTNLVILDGIGSTELLHIFISNRPGDYKPGSSGRVVPGYETRIVDENGTPVAPGEVGRLMVKGESAARCYWNNPKKTAETMRGEWISTGDTYLQDDKGYYVYCGRSDDMLKVGGIWCSPVEIESRLVEHPKVLEAAVVGRADDDALIKPEAYVVLNDASDASDTTACELLRHCQDGLARYKYPRRIHFVDELPKTATGKIQRFQLRRQR